MWWNYQNLDLPREDSTGQVWHFRIWHDHVQGVYIQRIFFWNQARSETGVIEMKADQTRRISRLKEIIAKLAHDPKYRARHNRPIKFPVERKYAAYEPIV
jgi:hypothetical protein